MATKHGRNRKPLARWIAGALTAIMIGSASISAVAAEGETKIPAIEQTAEEEETVSTVEETSSDKALTETTEVEKSDSSEQQSEEVKNDGHDETQVETLDGKPSDSEKEETTAADDDDDDDADSSASDSTNSEKKERILENDSDESADDETADDESAEDETADSTAVSDERILTEETTEEAEASFKQNRTVDGVRVTVAADKGVFPDGAKLKVTKVDSDSSEASRAEDAVKDERASGVNVAASYTFDISILDEEGNEIEPDTDAGTVHVSFSLDEVADDNLETSVYHVTEDSEGDLNASALNVKSTGGNTAVVETDGFSLYVVEFTYNKRTYVLNGGGGTKHCPIF